MNGLRAGNHESDCLEGWQVRETEHNTVRGVNRKGRKIRIFLSKACRRSEVSLELCSSLVYSIVNLPCVIVILYSKLSTTILGY